MQDFEISNDITSIYDRVLKAFVICVVHLQFQEIGPYCSYEAFTFT